MTFKHSQASCAAAMALVIGCLFSPRPAPARAVDTTGRGSLYGKTAPDFRIKGPHGETYTLKKLRGNILVLQFGTSW